MSRTRALLDLVSTQGVTVAALSSIGDTSIAQLGDNQFLVWDNVAGRWKNSGMKGAHFPSRETASERSERRAIKRAMHVPVSLYDYAPSAQVDYHGILLDAFTDLGAQADKRLYIPPQNYQLHAGVTMDYPIDMFGETMSTSVFRLMHSGTGLQATGRYGTGGRLRDLTFAFDTGGGTSICQVVLAAYQNPANIAQQWSPDFFEIGNLNLTGFSGSKSQYNLILDGNGRVNNGGGSIPIGLRNIVVNRIEAFNATFRSFDVRHVRSARFHEMAIFGGNGVGGAAVDAIAGQVSSNVSFFQCTINGTTTVQNSISTHLYGVATTVSEGPNNIDFRNL